MFFFLKKKKISFKLKLLFEVRRLNHVGDSMTNVVVLNNSFTIFLNSFIIF